MWLRCDKSGGNCTAISGATGTHHTVTSADLGTTLRFEVTASNSDGKNTATSNPTAEITNGTGVPANSSPPTITGTAAVDNTLTAGIGSWVGDQPITYSYQWQHCDKSGNSCGSISNATKSTYKISQKQFDRTIRLKVIAKNTRGNANAISVQTAVVAASSGGGGSGIINLPNGGKSVDVVDVPPSERLIVQTVDFNPNPVRSRTQPITITVTVKDTPRLLRPERVRLRPLDAHPHGHADRCTNSRGRPGQLRRRPAIRLPAPDRVQRPVLRQGVSQG